VGRKVQIMSASRKRLFEVDRKMELRLRLAAKNAGRKEQEALVPLYVSDIQKREMVYRIIERVRKL
jgi:hypothetical protein